VADAPASVVETTERYYDSSDADTFYERIWGGEDIHIGLYESDADPIVEASHRTVETMADRLEPLSSDARVLDLGAGYGGSARHLARRFGCHVTCLNLSERQNRRNAQRNVEEGLEGRVTVRHGNFESLPFPAGHFDVVWSQDAFLHSGRRRRVLEEASRVLARGGQLLFTDPMQADDCPPGVLGPVYERIHLDSMGSFAFYRKVAAELDLEEVGCVELTQHLRAHYARVRAELERQRPALGEAVSEDYVQRMLDGLASWVHAADEGWLAWGILHFRRP
jgi:sarcosine/dimethylglycine N-methyltransferase